MKFEVEFSVGCLTFCVRGEKDEEGTVYLDRVQIATGCSWLPYLTLEVDPDDFYDEYDSYIDCEIHKLEEDLPNYYGALKADAIREGL